MAVRGLTLVLYLLYLCFSVFVCLALNTHTSEAHRSGCHRWHSCPSDSGSYICGDTGHTSGCTATPTNTPPPAPHVPVRTTRLISSVEPIAPPQKVERKVSNEYIGYKHTAQSAQAGAVTKFVKVNLVDNVEENRASDHGEILTQPQPEIVEIGARKPPTASIDSLKKVKKNTAGKSKYDVSGTTSSTKRLVLIINGKEVASTKAKNGRFVFHNSIVNDRTQITVSEKDGGFFGGGAKNEISETATITNSLKNYTTEYQSNHKQKPISLKIL